jgi:hypothetical protein
MAELSSLKSKEIPDFGNGNFSTFRFTHSRAAE